MLRAPRKSAFIDERSADAHAALRHGQAADFDSSGAIAEFLRAIELGLRMTRRLIIGSPIIPSLPQVKPNVRLQR